ncbi:CaiB/BaiF CoA-transferase family protein [Mycolicibacterium sphagni]|uniref:CaiB/BaiF CoA-transferase family protein n=1 Tax=Mycolicibacterium sphagni TaxID=1786 RepID=UPI0021F3575E|nr:CoA transferase [Mycolicibacterium sphagni]MCV7178200.1 CoA transferase [Mycolicibacterium sphagni]
MVSPLSGIRVLEIGDRIATAYCGKLLRDAGADVVMVEPPPGHRLRRYRPVGVQESAGDSPFFSFLAGGKRSVTSATVPRELLEWADVVILGATPAEATALGLGSDEIARCTAEVITVSDFGWAGPWTELPATEFTLQAWCGSTGSRGEPDRPPIAVGGDLGEFIAGSYAAFFALGAYRGGGSFDLSVLEAMTTSMQVFSWLRKELMLLEVLGRTTEVPSVERAQDGYVGISMATGQQWQDFCAMVECPDLADVPELRFQVGRWEQRDLIRARTADFFATHTVAEIVELAALFRIPMTAIGNGETLSEMDHFVARGSFLDHPAGFRAPGPPWRMSRTPPLPPALPPALSDTGVAGIWPLRERQPARSSLPLDGVRVVDLTAFWAGPSATHLLAMLGADVVKIESVQRPDGMRFAGGFREDVERWWEYSWVFHGVNSGKRSVTLDLGSEDGRTLFGRLVAEADVVIENFTPRVMENFGLGDEQLRGFNEQIIEVRMPGFGLDGPWRDRVGFAMTMEQLAGLAWLTGYPDGLPTAPRGACDPLAGVHAAFLTLAALEHRRRTGQGQLIEVPMIDVVLNASALQVIERDAAGVLLTRQGNRGHEFAVQNVYACAGDDQWIAVSVRHDGDWQALKAVLGQPMWTHGVDYTAEEADVIDGHLAGWLKDQARDEAVTALLTAGIPAAPVVQPPEVIDNPALRARGFFQPIDHPLCGPLPYSRPPVTGYFVTSAAPLLGQHNAEILGGSLGLTDHELDRLADGDVIGTWPLGL